MISVLNDLIRDDLVKILTEPKNALVKQYKRIFEYEDVDLVFKPEALKAIADNAIKHGTGARGLRAILEDVLLDIQYELPNRREVTKCVVTRDTITRKSPPTLVTKRPASYTDKNIEEETA